MRHLLDHGREMKSVGGDGRIYILGFRQRVEYSNGVVSYLCLHSRCESHNLRNVSTKEKKEGREVLRVWHIYK